MLWHAVTFWLGSPLKAMLWLGNRLATWTGLFFLWKRFRESRFVWVWLFLINAVSIGGLVMLLRWVSSKR